MGGILEQIQAQLDRIEAKLAKCAGPSGDMVSQRQSPLGGRKHIAAVKRRAAEAEARGIPPLELGAAIDGERYYLSPQALGEELSERTRASLSKATAPVANDTDEDAAYRRSLERGRRARGDAQ